MMKISKGDMLTATLREALATTTVTKRRDCGTSTRKRSNSVTGSKVFVNSDNPQSNSLRFCCHASTSNLATSKCFHPPPPRTVCVYIYISYISGQTVGKSNLASFQSCSCHQGWGAPGKSEPCLYGFFRNVRFGFFHESLNQIC